ncbi:MAG: hypothetical protein ABI769_11010 [Pseudomonadota bacterium]
MIAALLAAFGVATNPAMAAPPGANPLGLFYNDSFANFEAYEHPTAIVVAGHCNRYDPRFSAARVAGAEVLAYINPIEVNDHVPCKAAVRAVGLYGSDARGVPLWPWPVYGARINFHDTHMADIRVGSEWSNRVVAYVERLMREDKVDGVFLDVVGARLWSKLAQWQTWDRAEQDAWTLGCIDLVRRMDASRRAINPKFIIINNNIWDRGDALGFEGEQFVDGIVLEHSKVDDYHTKYAARNFGDLGHRRVLVIARSTDDAQRWAEVHGVTHVTDQGKYDHPGLPLTPFTRLEDRPKNH